LTDLESAFVAIVYNIGFGNFKESRELKQGFNDGAHFYGENIDRYLQIAGSQAEKPVPTLLHGPHGEGRGIAEGCCRTTPALRQVSPWGRMTDAGEQCAG
jgi:hypothetical protein